MYDGFLKRKRSRNPVKIRLLLYGAGLFFNYFTIDLVIVKEIHTCMCKKYFSVSWYNSAGHFCDSSQVEISNPHQNPFY